MIKLINQKLSIPLLTLLSMMVFIVGLVNQGGTILLSKEQLFDASFDALNPLGGNVI